MKTLHCVLVVLFSSTMMLPVGPVCSEETGPGVSPQISDVENAAPAYARWSLPEGATVRLGKGYIKALQFAPDGNRFVVATSIGIWVYDAHTGEEIALYTGHSRPVSALAFSPDGVVLASGDESGEVRLWRAGTGQLLSVLQPGRGDNKVMALVFTEDGTKLIGAGLWEIQVWELGTEVSQPIVTRLEGLLGPLSSRRSYSPTVFSPDGRFLASQVWDSVSETITRKIYVWDVATGSLLSKLVHAGWLEAILTWFGFYKSSGYAPGDIDTLAFSPDSKTLATVGSDTIRLWDMRQAKPRATSKWELEGGLALAFSPESQFLASGLWNGEVHLWHTTPEERQEERNSFVQYSPKLTLKGHKGVVSKLLFSPDGRTLITGSVDGLIKAWDTASGNQRFTCEAQSEHTWRASFTEKSGVFTTVTWPGNPRPGLCQRLWDVKTGEQLALHFLDAILPAAISPDATTFVSHRRFDYTRLEGNWEVWDSSNAKRAWAILLGHPNTENPFDVLFTFAPDGKILASAGKDNSIYLWEFPERSQLPAGHGLSSIVHNLDFRSILEGDGQHISALAFSSDAKMLASGSDEAIIRLWDVESGDALFTLTGHDRTNSKYFREIVLLAFSPDGKTLASASRQQLCLWDIVSGNQLSAIPQQWLGDVVMTLVFSPDGSTLVCGNWEGKIQLRTPRTATPISTHIGHTRRIGKLQFSPDGKTLASVGGDGTVLLWDWEKISRLEDR